MLCGGATAVVSYNSVPAEDAADDAVEFVPPHMSIHYQGTYEPIEEMIPPASEDERFVERSIPCHQTRGLPIPSRTRMRPKVRWDPARSSSRRRRTTSGGRGSRSEATRVEGSCSSSEGAYVSPVGQGEATLAFRGGGMYEVSSSSQQPPHPQPRVDLGWTGPTLSFPPPAETGADAGAGAGAGGEVIPRTTEFYAMMGLHPPAP